MSPNPRHLTEAQFQRLLEVVPDACVLTREDGTIARVNRHCEDLFGYTRDELVGQSVEILLPGHLREAHQRHRAGYHANPRVRAMGAGLDLYGRRKGGAEFPVDISLGPIQTEQGRLFLAAVRDATQRKHAEDVARRLEDDHQRRRQALELNDGVVQGLVAAQMALTIGDTRTAGHLLETTLASARSLITDLLSELDSSRGLQPGDLVRSRPATLD